MPSQTEAERFDQAVRDLTMASVTCEFELSPLDIITPPPRPPPVTISFPRSSFLFGASQTLLKTFKAYVADFGSEKENVWLQYNGEAVPWHVPVGVFADRALLAGASSPLIFVVRLSLEPVPQGVVRGTSRKEQLGLAANFLKQTCSVCFTSTKPFLNLHPDVFSKVVEFALETEPSPHFRDHFEEGWAEVRQKADGFVRYPIKVHAASSNVGSILYSPPADAVNEHTTLREVLDTLGAAANSICRPSSTGTAAEGAVTAESEDAAASVLPPRVKRQLLARKVIIFGIPFDSQTPFDWLFRRFTYADGMLHVVVLDE